MRDEVPRRRWLEAQKRELESIKSAEDIKEWLRVRRITWTNLCNLLKSEVPFENLGRVLEIGGGPTSIFLAVREGERYAVDPMYKSLFELHPFLREIEEYRDVHFVASSIEEAAFDGKFDLIVSINMLDHIGSLTPVTQEVDELLASRGLLIAIVDCYADPVVRNIIRFFDADMPHIHHMLDNDIIQLFSKYKLVRQDNQIHKVLDEPPFQEQKNEIELHRFDKFLGRMRHDLKIWGKERDMPFIFKFIVCYCLALAAAGLRRRETPIHPLKKARLFIFQKK
jgi:SAM-dependent methyltransferase